jgi:2-methylcitrate dehydratase PrpD
MTIASTPKLSASTAGLASRCASIAWDGMPPDVRERTKELVLDLIGVALRGGREPSSLAAREAIRDLDGGHGGASVFGSADRLHPPWAALANGTGAHALELDDVTTESSLHPGVAVIPAAFAFAEERGASGPAFLGAVAAGYEATVRVGNALGAASAYRRGFHPTGVAGVFGATAAAGRLLGLDADALTSAFGIAGTMAAGSLEYLSDGSWTKRLNPGWAGHAGIVAAQLAAAGFRGPSTAIEGPLGVLHAFSDDARSERLAPGPTDGSPWALMDVSIKPYACCRYNHGLIDGVLRLREEHGVTPGDVERIRLGVVSGGALLVSEPIEAKRAPRSIVDAQFSAPFAAAVALVRGAAGLRQFTQSNIDDPVIRGLMSRTDCVTDSSLDAAYPKRWPATVELSLRGGRVVRTRVDDATGEPRNPVGRDALVAKFSELADGVVERADEIVRRILSLENERDLSGVAGLLRA